LKKTAYEQYNITGDDIKDISEGKEVNKTMPDFTDKLLLAGLAKNNDCSYPKFTVKNRNSIRLSTFL
jgi:hypothetical protein